MLEEMAKSRKNMRKSSRKASRKSNRKNARRSSRRCWTRRNNMTGGAAPVGDSSMVGAGNQNLAQGRDYLNIHRGQHGGGAVSLAGAPVGYTGMLDDALRASARIGPLDNSISAIQGMRDQSGGGRRRKGGKKSKAVATRKLNAARAKILKLLRRMSRRKMRGGAALAPADYGSPGMLLGSADAAKALAGMNPEWKLATNPAAFAPK